MEAVKYIQLQFIATPDNILMNHPGPAGAGIPGSAQKMPGPAAPSVPNTPLTGRTKSATDENYEQDTFRKIFNGTHNRVTIYDPANGKLQNQKGTTCGCPEWVSDGYMYQWIFLDNGGLIYHPVIYLYIYEKITDICDSLYKETI